MATSPLLVGTGLRGRVERLLRGDIRQQDLHELVFNMRDEAGGKGVISEVANFLAHPIMRDRGIATREMRDMFAFLKFRIPMVLNKVLTRDIPASVPDAMRGNLRRMRSSTLVRETGMNRIQAGAVLERILGRLVPTTPGRLSKLSIKDRDELTVATCVASHIKGGPLFNSHDLFEDFCRALKRQSVLSQQEKEPLKKAKAPLSLFALIAMHNRLIDLGDDSAAKLTIASDIRGRLGIFAFTEIAKDYGSGRTTGICWLFETHLPIDEYCELGVAPINRAPFIGEFEIGPGPKLKRVD